MFTVIGVFNLFFEIATAAAAQAPDPQAIVKPLPLSKTLSWSAEISFEGEVNLNAYA